MKISHNSSILITGSTGFLGKALVKHLKKKKYYLISLQVIRSNTKKTKNTLVDETIYVESLDNVNFQLKSKKIDAIVHLATDYGIESPDYVKSCNYDFPKALLDYATQNSIKFFLNADTFFSDLPDSYPYLKEYRNWKKLLRDYGKKLSLSNKICFYNLRIFHMFGPSDSAGKFVHDMKKKMSADEDLIDLTDCTQLRDFIYIDDVVSAFEIVLRHRENIRDSYKNYDVGSGKKVSIKYFLLKLKEKLNSKSYLNFGALTKRKGESDLELISADIKPLLKLGWKISKKLDDNISSLIK